MSTVKSFMQFHGVDEADGAATEAKLMEIDGVKYTAVPSTYKAVGAKQKELGQESVGLVSLPNDPEIYELFPFDPKAKSATSGEGKDAKGKEDKDTKNKEKDGKG